MVHRRWLALILLCGIFILSATEPADSLYTEAADSLFIELQEDTPELADSFITEPLPQRTPLEKEELLIWIDSSRQRKEHHLPLYIAPDKMALAYRFGTNFAFLDSEPILLKIHGFQKPGSLMSTSTYLDYFSRYHQPVYGLSTLDFTHENYQLPISVSGLSASLGDYSNQEIAAFFKRQELFGVPALGLDLDYSLQNGYWLDASTNGSSYQSGLHYHTPDYGWQIEYAGYQKEGSNQQLVSGMYTNQIYRVKHEYNHLYSHLYYRWMNLYILKSSESSNAYSWQKRYKSDALQIAAEPRFTIDSQRFTLRYEYMDGKRNYHYVESNQNEDYRHKASINWEGEHFLDYALEAESLDFERFYSKAKLSRGFGAFGIGLYDSRRYQPPKKDYLLKDPISLDEISLLQSFHLGETAIFGSFRRKALDATISIGYQNIWQNSSLQSREEDQLFCRISGEYKPRFGDWELRLSPAWKIQDSSIQLMENPRYSFSSSQSLSRHLGHDNRIEAGFSLLGHSEYYLANPRLPALVEASTSLDAWILLKIGRLFDISVEAQNIMNTSVFGLYPIPRSIHARVHWYFIN